MISFLPKNAIRSANSASRIPPIFQLQCRYFAVGNQWSDGKRPTYAIVGAGSAGCVLANRLSENPDANVLLVEAGPPDNWWRWSIHMPGALIKNARRDKYNWNFKAEPEPSLHNRVVTWPRGRVWGGSSSLNAMIYMRGHPLDYDRWETEGATGWSYAQCLPYFKRAQTHSQGPNEYRGGSGPLGVSYPKYSSPLHHVWLEAGQQAGYNYTDDFNGFQQEGFGPFHLTVWRGKRSSTSQAYLWPVLKRPNLWTLSGAHVNKVLFEGRRTVGLEVEQNGSMKNIYVESDVILSAGAVMSPAILQLSGVGDADQLRKLDIPVVHHVPGVGSNLQDHMGTTMQVAIKKPVSQCRQFTWRYPHNIIRNGLQWFINKTGFAASVQMESGAFIRTDDTVPHPDIQYHFTPLAMSYHDGTILNQHAFQVHSEQLRPSSCGTIRLRSRNPKDPPIIRANYLDTQLDRDVCRKGFRAYRNIVHQKAFEPYIKHEIAPGFDHESDKQVDNFIRENSSTTFHPCGTCKMGLSEDKSAVIDGATMKVWGMEGIRVADASVMPSIPSGNTNSPTIMVGEHAADLIQGKQKLKPEQVPISSANI